jgi:16S rRNA (cytidine1402-2'-O)-methyltransferase
MLEPEANYTHDKSSLGIGPQVILVPTPIGNLGDITLRALEALRQADLIACEDTRHSRKLLDHYQIDRTLVALHAHNEHGKIPRLLADVQARQLRLAYVSDAGTPGLSDPGYLLVREALALGLHVTCLPGPTAAIPALVMSGLPADRFVFEGFLPPKKGRNARLDALQHETRTIILYESPYRVLRTLTELVERMGADRPAAVCREISKLHETCHRGSLAELLAHFELHAPRGEFVLVVAGAGRISVSETDAGEESSPSSEMPQPE